MTEFKRKKISAMSQNVKDKIKIVPKTLSKASVKKNNQVPKNIQIKKKKVFCAKIMKMLIQILIKLQNFQSIVLLKMLQSF